MAERQTEQSGQPLKYTLTHYCKPERTHEAFIKWIVEEHLPLAIPVFKKHGIIEYSLFVTPPALSSAIKQEIGKVRPTWDVADFDCFIEYTLPDAGVIQKVMSDPDWAVALKDQDDWVDTAKSLVSLGYCTPYLLKTGEVVNMPKKTDLNKA